MSPNRATEYGTKEELAEFKEHLLELAEAQTHVLRAEIEKQGLHIDERIKALTWRGLLALGAAVGLLRFDLPAPVTAGAVAVAVAASLLKACSAADPSNQRRPLVNKTALTVNAVTAVLALLVLLDVIHLSSEALAAIGVAVTTILAAGHAWFDSNVPFGPTDGEG